MAIELHPNFLSQNGTKVFAVLPYEEYLAIQEILEDWEDLNDLRQAKQDEENLPILSLEEVKKELGLENHENKK